ncbi:hypothetical protein QOT17_016270 [Balamuthia mandrillaris]
MKRNRGELKEYKQMLEQQQQPQQPQQQQQQQVKAENKRLKRIRLRQAKMKRRRAGIYLSPPSPKMEPPFLSSEEKLQVLWSAPLTLKDSLQSGPFSSHRLLSAKDLLDSFQFEAQASTHSLKRLFPCSDGSGAKNKMNSKAAYNTSTWGPQQLEHSFRYSHFLKKHSVTSATRIDRPYLRECPYHCLLRRRKRRREKRRRGRMMAWQRLPWSPLLLLYYPRYPPRQ